MELDLAQTERKGLAGGHGHRHRLDQFTHLRACRFFKCHQSTLRHRSTHCLLAPSPCTACIPTHRISVSVCPPRALTESGEETGLPLCLGFDDAADASAATRNDHSLFIRSELLPESRQIEY